MAEIEIDISLLSANPVDVDSPYANQGANVILSNPAESSVTGATQSLIADIFAVGPSGPTGPQGPSGEMGPSGAVGPSGQINTGELDKRYYSINNPSGFITGVDLSQYATTINLALTGSELNNKINLLSGVTVLKFGNESITGIKDFINRPTVNTIPVLLSGENSNGLSVLVKNDDSVTLQKGQPVYIFGANGNNILVRRAANTGEATSSKTLGLLNQTLAPNDQGYVISEGGLEGIDTSAGNAGDPIWLGSTGNLIFGLANKPYAPNHLVYLGVVERQQANNGKIYIKVQNGFELQELHNVNIDHSYILNNDDVLRYNTVSGLWFNQSLNTGIFKIAIENTGSILNSRIDSLSGVAVLTYGNQTIFGNKTFNDNTYINNLFVTGTQTIVSTNNFSVQSPYLLLNLTGGAVDGGIFFVTGNGLTGLNDAGPIIGFDHSKNFKFGISTRNSDLSSLPDIASVQEIRFYSGFVDDKYSTITNLVLTGSILDNKINALSGNNYLTSINASTTYATITNLASTGSTLQTNINNLSGYINSSNSNIVFTTGNQIVEGFKTFNSGIFIPIQPSGSLNPVSLNITGTFNSTNTTFTGINLNVVDVNGNTNTESRLISLRAGTAGGVERFWVNTLGSAYAAGTFSVGGNLVVPTNNALTLNPATRLYADGSGDLSIRHPTYSTQPFRIRVFNATGTNSGEFGLFGWRNNQLIIGPQQINSGILRDLILTGNNININGFGAFNIFDNTNINGDLNVTGNILLSGNQVLTGVNLSNYVTKINGQFNNRPTVNGTGVLLSGEAANIDLSSTVQITGDQNISDIKNFYSRPTVNGTGVLLSGEAAGGGEKRHDFVTGSPYDYSYCGTAPANSLESASIWNITRLSIDSAGLVAFNQSVTNYSWTGRYLAPYS